MLQIQFVGVRGGGFRGDIAIDDVHFMAGDCSTGKMAIHFEK